MRFGTTIERELGQGGLATVYLAEDPRHHTTALEMLAAHITAEPKPLEQFGPTARDAAHERSA